VNLAKLVEECERRSGYNDVNFRPYWKTYINQALREFARAQPWAGLEDLLTAYADGTEYLVLPYYVDTVVSIFNKTDNLPVRSLGGQSDNNSAAYGQRTEGPVREYCKLGETPTIRDPTGYMTFQSSHASDMDWIYVTGLVANSAASGTALGIDMRTSRMLATGLSPVTLDLLFSKVISIGKTTDSNGAYDFNDQGSANFRVSHIERYDGEAVFRRIQLFYKPTAGTQFEVKFRYRILPLRDDAQVAPPAVKSDYLIASALGQYYQHHDQFQKAMVMTGAATKIIEAETNREENFNESESRMIPYVPDDID